jgi:uncharacterized membrane protein
MKTGWGNFLFWLALTLGLAVVLHFVIVWQIPSFVTNRSVEAFFARKKVREFNRLFHNDLTNAGSDLVPMSNADIKNSLAVFDVSEKPVRIRCVVPNSENYWSISLYAWNTDNFFVRNDRSSDKKEFDLVIVKPDSKYQKQTNEEVIVSPTLKGVVLIRFIVSNRNDQNELVKLNEEQPKTTLQVVETSKY